MAINKKLVNFKKKEDYTKQKEEGNILDTTIVFIDDTKEIVTHNTVFNCNGGGEATTVNADWLANEGEDGYIKNKPLVEVSDDELLYKNHITPSGNSGYFKMASDTANNINIIIGDSYKVIIDNREWIVDAVNFNGNNWILSNGVFVNNPFVGDFTIYQTPSGFMIGVKDENNKIISYDLEIYHITGKTKKQIDSNYLPIVQTIGDSETQIMSQKAVTNIFNGTVNKVTMNGGSEYTPQNGELNLGYVVNQIRINGSTYYPNNVGIASLNNIVTSVTANGKKQTNDVDLSYIDEIIENRVTDGEQTFPLINDNMRSGNFRMLSVNNSIEITDKEKYLLTYNDKSFVLIGYKNDDYLYYLLPENTEVSPSGYVYINGDEPIYYRNGNGGNTLYVSDDIYNSNVLSFSISKLIQDYQINTKHLPIVQEIGDSDTMIMSQKAVTDKFNEIMDILKQKGIVD